MPDVPHPETLRDTLGSGAAGEGSTPGKESPYRILEVLGEGGMGTVYKAEQRQPVQRLVAIKVIKLGMDSRDVVARFAAEQQALAAMNHSGIAKVFDAGTTGRGQPYFVMELVEGLPLTDYCDKHELSVPERIDLFQQVCGAVQHAHQKGVVHRDLKPGNILVAREGAQAAPKILDFGLAKAMDRDQLAQTVFTERDQILGTPEYMAPEQAAFDPQAIDTRADIYALGVILFELLCGELPFSSQQLREAGWLGIQRTLTEEEPPKPSSKLGSTALARAVRGDLDWIVLKALSKEPERRYASAAELALDLQRHLDHEPVLAGPPSTRYRMRKLMQRYRGQVVAGLLVLITLIGGIIGTAWYAFESDENANRAGKKAKEALDNAKRANLNLKRFNLLTNVVRLEKAKAREKPLRIASPGRATAMRLWLREHGEPLEVELVSLERALVALRQRGQRDEQQPPQGFENLQELEQLRAALIPELEKRKAAYARSRAARRQGAKFEAQITELEAKIAPLRKHVEHVWPYLFEDDTNLFLHDTLVKLIADVRTFTDPEHGLLAGVRRRLAWAEKLDAIGTQHPNARATWDEAREAIGTADGTVASTLYRDSGIDLQPQVGLVPIGMNPITKLWEFYHLRSAWDARADTDPAEIPIPEHAGDGSIEVGDGTGIVFVLLPGGTFVMGAQKEDPSKPNYDPMTVNGEDPSVETVRPLFVARHELTQGQWQRLKLGDNPSRFKAGFKGRWMDAAVTLAHPVERVSWHMCDDLVRFHGLTLPRDVEWEYACRAGTQTPWSCGSEVGDLEGFANLLDQRSERFIHPWTTDVAPWDDGFVQHAPVGSFGANDFGLFDMHGNVWEWCQDSPPNDSAARHNRGAEFNATARHSRSAFRNSNTPIFQHEGMGMRAARALH